MEAGVADQVAYLAADLQFHDRILSAAATTSSRPPRRRPARCAPHDVRADDDTARPSRRRAAPAPPRDPRRDRAGDEDGAEVARARPDRRHRRRHSAHRPALRRRQLGRRSADLELDRAGRAGTTTSMRPSAASTTRPGAPCCPRSRPSGTATSRVAPIASASSTASAASMLPTIPARLALGVPPVDREQRDVDARRRERVGELVGDDRVAGVVDAGLAAERIADEPRASADGAAVAVRVLHATPWNAGTTWISTRRPRRVVRVDAHEPRLAARRRRRPRRALRRTTRSAGERSRSCGRNARSRWSRCSCVTSSESTPSAASASGGGGMSRSSCGLTQDRRRATVLADLEPEAGLAEPRQTRLASVHARVV